MSRPPPNTPSPRPGTARPANPRSGGRLNSLGLEGKQLDALMDRIDGRAGPADRRRKFFRMTFREASLELHITQPGGSVNKCRVACRNLSCGGMSVMHSAFIYPGSACVAHLPLKAGGTQKAPGTVMRCTHSQGVIHEIGIRFDTPIAVDRFVGQSPLASQFSLESVEPDALVGSVLYVDRSPLDQKLVQHYLRGTNLRLRTAETAEATTEACREGCDVVLCDYQPEEAEAVIRAARAVLSAVPVVLVVRELNAEVEEFISRLSVDVCITKPFDDALLLRALAEFLLMRPGRSAAPESSAGSADSLGADLADIQARLGRAAEQDDAMTCYILCQQVVASAKSLRLTSLAHTADKALQSLAASMSVEKSRAEIESLIGACGKRAAA